ncbi:hypothetical protein OROGR_003714 [Orobanche gracilis]
MDSKKIISPEWSDCFPAGLRVFVLDDDPTHLKVLENMLNKCNYQVTTCNLMREALDLLQERKDGFDIVMSNVSLSDMDAFELLKQVRLKMNIPVIMMSVDGETSTVMKGVQHGACDYLMKPIRMEELQNIWQHVVRKRICESRDIQVREKPAPQMMRNPGNIFSSEKKRKDVDTRRNHDRESSRGSSVKKARVVWTTDLHHKFVKAVDQIGIDKVGPKKILNLMGVPWLTRENVASHLQKYRLYLRRLQEENEVKVASARIKKLSCTSSSTDPADAKNVSLQSSVRQTSITVRQNLVTNGKYFIPQHKIQIHNNTSTTTTTTSRVSLNNHFVGPHFELEGYQFDHHQRNKYVSHDPAPPSTECYDGIGKVTVAENNKDALVSVWSTRNQNITTQNVVYDHLDSSMRNLIVGESPQDDLYPLNQDGLGSFGCSINQELIADIPRHMYDPVNFDCGYYSGDSLECLINQGLYIS